MSVFLIVLKNPIDDVKAQTLFNHAILIYGALNVKEICSGQILVSSEKDFMPDAIARNFGDEFSNGSYGSYIIVPVPAYWGYHDRVIWGWLKEKGL